MRLLNAVSAATVIAALANLGASLGASPAARAQGDARESYGPVAAARAKPEPKAKTEAPKPEPSKTALPKTELPKTELPKKPAKDAKAATPPASQVATDGKSASGKNARNAKAKLAATAKPETTGSLNTVGAEKLPALRDAYTALPMNERLAIQLDLIWAGDYRGLADGEFSDKLIDAVKDYQKRNKLKVTGLLAPEERTALAAAVEPRQSAADWEMVEDPVSGARLGIPAKFATKVTPGPNGTRWSSEQGQLQIETFRIDTGATLEAVFDQQKKMPRRRVPGSSLLSDSFVIIGMQGLKKMRVVGFVRDGEVRGLTILYDQAMEGSIDPLVLPISGTYLPFAQGLTLAAADAPRRKVEYGTGVFVSAAGHVLTDRRVVEGCPIITLPGLGYAERVADDRAAGLALLRINGVSGVGIAPLAADAEDASDVTLVGVADPAAQAGGSAVSTVKARISAKTLDPAPALGFAGGAAFNASGRLAGLVQLQPVLTSSTVASPAKAAVVSVDAIRGFLKNNGVAPSDVALDDTKSAVTRVICVRK
jgi:peptidoglycan hydrolase-like protein with peptidoglycan-binding domain